MRIRVFACLTGHCCGNLPQTCQPGLMVWKCKAADTFRLAADSSPRWQRFHTKYRAMHPCTILLVHTLLTFVMIVMDTFHSVRILKTSQKDDSEKQRYCVKNDPAKSLSRCGLQPKVQDFKSGISTIVASHSVGHCTFWP